jgi:predicted transposase/invertase (TIGR01784 family)
MDPVHNPHDWFFKETFTRVEVARDFVEHYLPPEIAGLLDPPTLLISKDTFVDEELGERFSDLLYQVELKGKGKVFVYLLFEHKSFQDPEVALYLLLLMVRIWIHYRKQGNKGPLPPILPLVVYHGERQWKVSPNFQVLVDLPEAMGRYVPKFEYLIWDLSQYSDEEIRGGVVLLVTFLLMKHIF